VPRLAACPPLRAASAPPLAPPAAELLPGRPESQGELELQGGEGRLAVAEPAPYRRQSQPPTTASPQWPKRPSCAPLKSMRTVCGGSSGVLYISDSCRSSGWTWCG